MPYLAFWEFYVAWAESKDPEGGEDTAAQWLLDDLIAYAPFHGV